MRLALQKVFVKRVNLTLGGGKREYNSNVRFHFERGSRAI